MIMKTWHPLKGQSYRVLDFIVLFYKTKPGAFRRTNDEF